MKGQLILSSSSENQMVTIKTEKLSVRSRMIDNLFLEQVRM
jgi:hypothetical protein